MRRVTKIGRNASCPCGSSRKYKHCHGSLVAAVPSAREMKLMQSRHDAAELIRTQQQGHGRPIIAAKSQGHQLVAVGRTIYTSSKWGTFVDFLNDYARKVLGLNWGQAELAKPLSERHPILQWFDAVGRQKATLGIGDGRIKSMPVTGAVAAYYGLAYGLYQLEHNVELQRRLLERLRDARNFQGAYYEVLVASALIRAGFELVLEDESDRASKHCEFAAISKATGKRYWIEAKMKAVNGLLGKTRVDGSTDANPTSHLIKHLTAALGKPADDERLIFIDLNTNVSPGAHAEQEPEFLLAAERRLLRFERSPECAGAEAYVFVTNLAFHRDLDGHAALALKPFGLNRADFNRPGFMTVSERYRQEQKHAEALAIAEAFPGILKFPATFDGALPAEAFDGALPPVKIGDTYQFEGVGPGGGMVGTVTSACVVEAESAAYVAITTAEGGARILKQPMTGSELSDYRAHGDAYFGEVRRVSKGLKTPLELFKWLMACYAATPREKLLEWLSPSFSSNRLTAMTDEELRITYCEGMTTVLREKTG